MEYKNFNSRYQDGGAAKTIIVNRGPAYVHWLSVFPETVATVGVITIYDGFDTGGKLKFQMEAGVIGHFAFNPPIPCEQGIYVGSDTNVGGWTIGYSTRGWPEKNPPPPG